ncbi:MAG TPA: ABC transporter permease, partial [Chitinophagaceae bacterium]|nr:ABC transporter permease [Chitinophagaceae bacterium]
AQFAIATFTSHDNNHMKEDKIWELLARKFSGEASEKELQELEELLRNNPELNYPAEILSDLWKMKTPAPDKETHTAYEHLHQQIKKQEATNNPEPAPQATTFYYHEEKRRPLHLPLLKSYATIAWRNIVRGKTFSTINIAGLALGMASAILILLWIHNELTIDSFHKNRDRIHLVYSRSVINGETKAWGGTSMLLAPILKTNYPEVEAAVRMNPVSAFIFHAGDKHLGSYGFLADPDFLKVFDYPLVHGKAETALSSPRSLVVTEDLAKRLFNSTDVLGKEVRIDSSSNFMITGVLKDLPANTQLNFEYLVPWSYMKEVDWDRADWQTSYIQTVVLLKEGVSESYANSRLRNIVKQHSENATTELFLHPLSKWRLWSMFENGKIAGGRISLVRLFGIIAGFILLIACINYMNLSTARSMKRAREVGIRKVAGAGKSSLIGQFLGESVIMTFIAGLLALVIAELSMKWFNDLTAKHLAIPYGNPWFWFSAVAFILFTGIVAGSYPAFYLAAYRPIHVLKGTFKAVHALITPRKVLVVVQFTIAIGLIICTAVIYQQIRYGQNRDVGYNQNNLVYVYIKGDMRNKHNIIAQELMRSGAITSMTRTNSPIIDIWNADDSYEWEGKKPGSSVNFALFHTDKDFVKTMGLELINGRDLNAEKYATDECGVLVNETALKMMGLKDPIGKPLKSREGNWHIVGVVKDFVLGNPYSLNTPIIIQGPCENHWFGTLTMKLNPARPATANVEAIGAILKKHNPDYPFEYHFVDQIFAARFTEEKHTASLATAFATLTILISCMGLFGLAAYMAENRTKEIGIRKVLGASVLAISTLLSKDFLRLVLLSFVIASPLAWWAMSNWLEHYAYRVRIGASIFIVTGIISIIIAILTVSSQAIKAAVANPAKSLRTE